MDMKHLIIKSENWADVNRKILYAFIKGFYTIASSVGECSIDNPLHYVKPTKVCMIHWSYSGYPSGPEPISKADNICLGEFELDEIFHICRIEDYGITWWTDKKEAEEALVEARTITIDQKIDE